MSWFGAPENELQRYNGRRRGLLMWRVQLATAAPGGPNDKLRHM